MSPPRRPRAKDQKEKESLKRTPRPGTMAYLRYVEELKRKETGDQTPSGPPISSLASSSSTESSKNRAHEATLPRTAIRKDTGSKASLVIHGAAVAAAAVGGGLAQIPFSGSVVITPIQISMIIALGSLQGKTLDKSTALGVLAAAYGPYVGRTVSQILIGWVPGVGNAINAATAFVVTESVGWAAHNILSSD